MPFELRIGFARIADFPMAGSGTTQIDFAGPYLGDTLAMGRAFLGLYAAPGIAHGLKRAREAMEFISENFGTELGYITSAHRRRAEIQPQLDENIGIVRVANLLVALYR